MVFNEPASVLAEKLRNRLSRPLPGETAQFRMTVRSRASTAEYLKLHTDHRKSAVLMMLYPHEETTHVLLIVRPEYDGVHSGQIALPGGSAESYDASLMHTAIRETREEVGVDIGEQDIVGELSPVFIPVSRFLVQPYIAVIPQRPEIITDPREVDSVIEIPLRTFLDDTIKEERKISIGKNLFVTAPCYIISNRILWGATAMMFSEMEDILRSL